MPPTLVCSPFVPTDLCFIKFYFLKSHLVNAIMISMVFILNSPLKFSCWTNDVMKSGWGEGGGGEDCAWEKGSKGYGDRVVSIGLHIAHVHQLNQIILHLNTIKQVEKGKIPECRI